MISPKTPFKERLGCLNGDPAAWREVFELNLFAPLQLARGFAPLLARGKGSVVNITSISAYASSVNRGDYCMVKAGLSMMTKLFADRLAEDGINVYEIRPGVIATDMTGAVTEK